jgi:tetratricopeptide (TPR) repeat protein
MRINKLVALFIIAIIVSPNLTIVRGQTLTLAPFDAEYEPGDDVSLSGTATAEANLTLIVVFNSTTLYEVNFTAEGDGNYTEEYEIPGDAFDGVYTVIVSDGGESAEADFTVSSDDESEAFADTFIDQAENAKESVEDAFDELEDEDVEIPTEANSSYLQGIDYLEMAVEDFDAGNYTEASENAFEAIQLFGDAFERVQDLIPVEPDDDDDDDDGDDEAGSPESLAVAIERAYVYWGRLNETVTRLSGEGYNVTTVVEALAEVEGHLDMASVYQEEGNHTAAVREFVAARSTLGRIHGYIESKIKERKEKQTEQFMEQFQRRVEKITGVLEGLQDSLEAGQTQRVRAILRSTAQKLLRMSDSLASGNLTQTLDEIEDAVDELDNGIDELNGEGLSKQIKSANRFEAKIESLNRTLRRLANAGFETSELDEYVTDANGLLARIEEEVRAGNDEEAEELIEEAEELLDEAQDHFKDFRKEARKASKGTENDRGRPESSGIRGGDDDEDDDDVDDEDDGNNVTASSASQGSDNITEELEELATAISGIENTLGGLSANLSITDVELILENATALMEEARAIVEENPDGAEELVEAAEELVEEALDLIEDMTGHDDDDGLEAIEPEDDDDDDEIDDHGDDDPDDHGDDDEPETTV